MTEYLQQSLTGLGTGSVVAALAIGIVLTYRASNVLNFAHAAMGMYIAYAYYGLRNFDISTAARGGNLVLPVLGLPAEVHVVNRPTVATALLIAVALGAVLGALVYGVVFRPLRHAPPLARVVASLGVFLYLTSVMQLRLDVIGSGAASLQLKSVLPNGVVHVGDAVVPSASFILAALAVGVTIALTLVFKFTRFGLATRAASENETGALLTGISPDRLGFANWIVATVLAGIAVIMFAGVASRLDPIETSLLVVPALAAALLGGLNSFALTTLAALVIATLQSILATFQVRSTWLPDWLPNGGLRAALPVVLIVVAITWRGARLPTRETLVDRRLPAAPLPRHPVVATSLLVAVIAVALLTLDEQWRLAIVVSIIAAIVGLSSVVLTGYVGQISLAQYAFAGLAAFTTAKLAIEGVAFPWAPLLAIAVTVVVGVLVGLPALRVRGMTLAVATLAAAVAIEALVFNSPSLVGLTDVPRPRLFGIDFGFLATGRDNFRAAFGLLALAALAACGLAVANLRRSPTGLRWLAVRSNERAAAAAGIDVSATKLGAFAISSALAGVGGALLAYELPALSPQQFMVVGALAVLALCYLGGIATISGALIAGVLASGGVLTQLQGGATGDASSYQFAVSGIALIVVVILYPDGLANAARRGVLRLRGRQ
jgi:ABC-type branched-subunit amino acid transport system permease subunit